MTQTENASCAWYLDVMLTSELGSRFQWRKDGGGYEETLQLNIVGRHFALAEPCDPDMYPKALIGRHFMKFRKAPPPLFDAEGLAVITEEMAGILMRFDLGCTTLPGTQVLLEDGSEAYPGRRFHCLAIAESRDAILMEHSPGVEKGFAQRKYDLIGAEADDLITLSPDALDPPDLWMQQSAGPELFCSDRLGQALIAAGWRKLLRMYRCQIRMEDV